MTERTTAKPRLLYLVTEDWYFISHRLPMARAARRAGYEVHVAARVDRHGAAIEAEGFGLHPLTWRRASANPLGIARSIREVRRLYRRLQPQLVHHVALQPVIVGSLAALGLPIARLNAIAGFGFSYTSNSPRAVLARAVMTPLMRFLLARPRSAVLVQNGDDRRAVEALGVAADNIFLVPGSGVDADVLTPLPEPQGPVCAAFVGRLLEDKGVRTLVAAHDLLTRRGSPVRLLLAGTTDPANPASVTTADVEDWKHRPGLVPLGHVADIATVWAQAHIAVLPSRREGLPKSLLEAAACGRPIVATDVPGCREIAIDGVNALLVPPDDPSALADAIDRLAQDAALRRTFGRASRQLVERQFASEHIGRAIVLVYDRLIGR